MLRSPLNSSIVLSVACMLEDLLEIMQYNIIIKITKKIASVSLAFAD
jgi:hypothetical protein